MPLFRVDSIFKFQSKYFCYTIELNEKSEILKIESQKINNKTIAKRRNK